MSHLSHPIEGARLELSPAESALAESLASMNEPALVTRADLHRPGPTIIAVSPALCAMTGLTAEEMLGQSPRIFQGPQTDRGVLDELRRACEAGRSYVGTTVNYRRNGERYIVHWTIDPMRNAEGVVTHFYSLQRDVSATHARGEEWLAAEERRHAAQSLASAQMALIAEAILVLEQTKRSFRSKELGALRQRLMAASRAWTKTAAGAEKTPRRSSAGEQGR